jgi:kynurenine formamidase
MPQPLARFFAVCALSLTSACAGSRASTPLPEDGRAAGTPGDSCLVDLSYAYDHDTVYWPTSPSKFNKETLFHGHTERGYFYSAFQISTPEHGGTHIDAPIHFAEAQDTTDTIPLERLIAPGVVIDMSPATANDPDALLSVEWIESFEAVHGKILEASIVLVHTGWGKHWPDTQAYLGDDTPGDASHLHFPGISEAAAQALVARRVAAVGIDTASIDHGPSKDFRAHRTLMEAGIPGFENVANLDQVPARGAEIIALPMKIAGGSGGPLRIVARVPSASCSLDRNPLARLTSAR